MTVPEIPADANGIVAWMLITVLVFLLTAGALLAGSVRWLVNRYGPEFNEMLAKVRKVEDTTNHRHPGQPTLADHAVMTRSNVRDLSGKIEKQDMAISELTTMLGELRLWAARWDSLPPELASDGALMTKFRDIETAVARIQRELEHHVVWEEKTKWNDIERLVKHVVAEQTRHVEATEAGEVPFRS
jgi:hypothetical protein